MSAAWMMLYSRRYRSRKSEPDLEPDPGSPSRGSDRCRSRHHSGGGHRRSEDWDPHPRYPSLRALRPDPEPVQLECTNIKSRAAIGNRGGVASREDIRTGIITAHPFQRPVEEARARLVERLGGFSLTGNREAPVDPNVVWDRVALNDGFTMPPNRGRQPVIQGPIEPGLSAAMAEGKGSALVHLLVISLSLTAFGFSIAAERRRSTGTIVTDNLNATYCVYDSDVATGYGVGAFLFLFSSQSLVMGITKCMCFGLPLAPGSSRAWTIIYFASSWLTFLVAEACILAGATKNAYHTKYRHVIYAQSWTCESLRKGVFIAGAVFVVFAMVLNVYYYMYFAKATSQAARKNNRSSSSVGMTGF